MMMPAPAVIVPVLTIEPPANVAQLQMKMPVLPAVIVPLFDMLPRNFETLTTTIPARLVAESVPELVIPPMKTETLATAMAAPEKPVTEMVPELLMPPAKVDMTGPAEEPCLPTRIPAPPAKAETEIVPELLMPPENIDILTDDADPNSWPLPTTMPLLARPETEIVPELLMPPAKVDMVTVPPEVPAAPPTTMPLPPPLPPPASEIVPE